MQLHGEPTPAMTLDGAQVADVGPIRVAEGLSILVRPVLAGGDPLPIPPGRYRFTSVMSDGDAIELGLAEA